MAGLFCRTRVFVVFKLQYLRVDCYNTRQTTGDYCVGPSSCRHVEFLRQPPQLPLPPAARTFQFLEWWACFMSLIVTPFCWMPRRYVKRQIDKWQLGKKSRVSGFSSISQSWRHYLLFDTASMGQSSIAVCYVKPGKSNWRRRISTVDLLVLTCLDQLLLILSTFITEQVTLMRRSTVLSFSLQLVFPG